MPLIAWPQLNAINLFTTFLVNALPEPCHEKHQKEVFLAWDHCQKHGIAPAIWHEMAKNYPDMSNKYLPTLLSSLSKR